MKWFTTCQNLEALKKAYKELVMEHHPDRGGDNATMAEINNEYEKMFAMLQKTSTNKAEQSEKVNEYRDIINELLKLHGLQIEICGAWLWISGKTYENKVALGKLDCNWAAKKKLWYWRPEESACTHNRHTQDMQSIRAKYGSQILVSRHPDQLAGA
jgi:hypothetical protein